MRFEVWQLTDQAIAVAGPELAGQASNVICHRRLHCHRIILLDGLPCSYAGRPCKQTPNASPNHYFPISYILSLFHNS